MSFGYDRQPTGSLNDTVVLDAYLYGQDGSTLVPQGSITSVHFTIVKPNGDPLNPDINNQSGTVVADGHGQFVAPASLNITEGTYKGIATFAYNDTTLSPAVNGLTKSIPIEYDIKDPFVRVGTSPADGSVRQCWTFLEDCFDSESGGPWLRDMTLAVFDQTKVRALVPQVLLDINNQMPFTAYTEASFPYTNLDGEALMAEGLLVASIRHLMRAYTEQPDIVGSPVAFMDRKRYQQAWKATYDVELPVWQKWLSRWKLQSYDLSSSAMLLGSKAGRMLPAPMRTRNAGFGF